MSRYAREHPDDPELWANPVFPLPPSPAPLPDNEVDAGSEEETE